MLRRINRALKEAGWCFVHLIVTAWDMVCRPEWIGEVFLGFALFLSFPISQLVVCAIVFAAVLTESE